MISKNAIPRYLKEQAELKVLLVKMKESNIRDLSWIKGCIETYEKRIKRIDELIKQRREWCSNPLCIATDQVLGRNECV